MAKTIDKYDLLDEGISLTDDPAEAIWLFPDGTMVDGVFSYGSRTEDHRIMERVTPDMDRYTPGFWEEVFNRTQAVMLIPESKQESFPEGMTVTDAQRDIMHILETENGYEYEPFQ